MSLFSELKRRNVLRVAAAYVVVAWVIVQVTVTLRELFPATPLWIGQTLIVLLALGVVPILLFSWFYELTPDGFKRDIEIGDDQSYADAAGRRLIYVTVAAVVVGVALFAWTREADEPALEKPETVQSIAANSVAVLPFINMSANADNEYFSDGLSETLLHLLAQVRDLKVAARTSSFAFKGKDTGMREIGAALGVAHVLEGSVQRAGDRVRITAQLIRVSDGFHAWSGNYDRELTDIFAIQDEIAERVGVELLANILNPAESNRRRIADTSSFKAYDLYLQARAETHKSSFEALQKAEGHLRAALEEDPGFLDAKVELASVIMAQADVGMRTFAENVPKMMALAREVLDSDPEHPRARILVIEVEARAASKKGDFSVWKKSEPALREIVAAAPDDIEVKMTLARVVNRQGNADEALKILLEVLEVDPLNAWVYEQVASAYADKDDWAAARDVMLRAVRNQPDAPNAWLLLGRIAQVLGDGVLTVDSYLNAQSVDPLDKELPGRTAAFLYSIGLPEEAEEFRQYVIRMAPDSDDAQNLNLLRAVALDDLDEAIQLARDIIEGGQTERMTAWHNAWQVLMFLSAERGTEMEDIALMDAYLEHFSDLDKIEIGGLVNAVRSNAIDVLATVKTEEELKTYRNLTMEYYAQLNVGMEDYPQVYMDAEIIFGNKDAAMQIALDYVFTEPVTSMQFWRLRFARPFMREFMSDLQIQAALEHWEQQEGRIRSEVRDYLVER